MFRVRFVSHFVAASILVALLLAGPEPSPVRSGPTAAPAVSAPGVAALGLPFVENRGQEPEEVRFTARTFAGTVRVTAGGDLVYSLPSAGGGGVVLRERSLRAGAPIVEAGEPAPTRVNVFRGRDPEGWVRGAPGCRTVRVGGAAPGVDLEVAAAGRNVEKRFRVAPGAAVDSIRMAVDGAEGLRVTEEGELEVATAKGAVRFTRPVAFQLRDGRHEEVAAADVAAGNEHGFRVAGRDPGLPLVIDPLVASTYVGGGSNDWGFAIGQGPWHVYVAGWTESSDFPMIPGAYDDVYDGNRDAFVFALDPDLETVGYATFLGGAEADMAFDMVLDEGGVYLVGRTRSTDFPVTAGAFQTVHGGSTGDVFVTRLSAELNLLHSTYIGGSGIDEGRVILLTNQHLYVAGYTRSTDFPLPAGGPQTQLGGVADVFVVGIDANDLSALTAGTLLGGALSEQPTGLAAAGDDLYVVGSTSSTDFPTTAGAYDRTKGGDDDGFVARFDADLTELRASTYLGGTLDEYPATGCADVALRGGDVFVCGTTTTADFPVTTGAYQETHGSPAVEDAWGARLSGDLSDVEKATFLGGNSEDRAYAIHGDDRGVFVTGSTESTDFPLAPTAFDDTPNGMDDVFFSVLDADLAALRDSTFIGGEQIDVAHDLYRVGDGFYVVGRTTSTFFPTTPDVFDDSYNTSGYRYDLFVLRLDPVLGSTTPPPPVESFFLPKRVVVKRKEKKPEKSKLAAAGFFDLGPDEVDLTAPATLTVGGAEFDLPGLEPRGRRFRYRGQGISFLVTPHKTGSSRAKFRLEWKGDLDGRVDPDAPLRLRFENDAIDGMGEVTLTRGKYAFGRVRGALLAPALHLAKAKVKLKGAGKDSLKLKLGLATDGGPPASAPDVEIRFGDATFSVPAASFTRKGDRFDHRGAAPGITRLILDYGRETIKVKGKGLDLGAWPDGPCPAEISIRVGDESYAVGVRVVKKGRSLRY